MLDYYGLGSGFPGQLTYLPTALAKVRHLERSLAADIHASLPKGQTQRRFLPYFQLHELEALFLSDPAAFAQAINQPLARFQNIRDTFQTPEDINNDPEGAPSQRILKLFPAYRKVLHGSRAAEAISIETMRQACPHFRDWTNRLAALASPENLTSTPLAP